MKQETDRIAGFSTADNSDLAEQISITANSMFGHGVHDVTITIAGTVSFPARIHFNGTYYEITVPDIRGAGWDTPTWRPLGCNIRNIFGMQFTGPSERLAYALSDQAALWAFSQDEQRIEHRRTSLPTNAKPSGAVLRLHTDDGRGQA
jgi:hypothetical protein